MFSQGDSIAEAVQCLLDLYWLASWKSAAVGPKCVRHLFVADSADALLDWQRVFLFLC